MWDDINAKPLLDRTAAYVRIHSADRSYHGAHSHVLFHLQNIADFLKLRGLIHILNTNPDGRHVFSVHAQKALVWMCVLDLYLKRVQFLLFIVQRLQRKNTFTRINNPLRVKFSAQKPAFYSQTIKIYIYIKKSFSNLHEWNEKNPLYLLKTKHAFLGVPVSADIEHIQTVSGNNGVVHLRISADVGIHSPDPANRWSYLGDLWNAELIYTWGT